MPVTSPTAGDVHVSQPLTNFSQLFLQSQDAFVAGSAWPSIPVTKQYDRYYVFDRADFFRDMARVRADGTESAGAGFNLSTEPYFAEVYAFHKDVTDRQLQNADTPVRLDQSASRFVTQQLLIRRERVMAENLFAPNVWFNGTGSASAGENVNWTTGDPIAQIRAAIRGVHQLTGRRPNKMLIGRTAYDTLVDNDEVIARISGGATPQNPAMGENPALLNELGLRRIHIMDAVVNTAAEGAAESNAFIGTSDQALVYYAPDTAGMEEPTAAVQFVWSGLYGGTTNGLRVSKFRMENLKAHRIEGEMAFDFKVVSGALGHLFTSVAS